MNSTGPKVECTSVRDEPGGWTCTVHVGPDAGPVGAEAASTDHDVRLAWCDHDFWSGGLVGPGEIIERLVRFLLDARTSPAHADAAIPWPLPPRFDAAKARRWCPAVDSELRTVG